MEQQGDEILDVLLGERARVAKARHLRAGVVRLGVVDLAVDILLHLRTVTTLFAEAEQARPDGPVRGLLRRDLVAVVAAAAGLSGLVAPHAAAARSEEHTSELQS